MRTLPTTHRDPGTKEKPGQEPIRRYRIETALFIGCLLFGSFLLIVSGVRLTDHLIGDDQSWAHEQVAAGQILNETNRSIVEGIERVTEPAMQRGRMIAQSPQTVVAFREGNATRLTQLCNDAVRNATEIDAVALFNTSGEIVAINTVYQDGTAIAPERVLRIMSGDFSDLDIITSCLKNSTNNEILEFQTGCDITPAFFDSSGLSVAHSIPVYDDQGNQIGVVSTRLRFERVSAVIDQRFADGSASVWFVTDSGGFFDEAINAGEHPPINKETLVSMIEPLIAGKSSSISFEHGGEIHLLNRMTNLKTMDGGGIQTMTRIPAELLVREARYVSAIHIGTPLAGGAVCILFAFLIRSYGKQRQISAIRQRDAVGLTSIKSRLERATAGTSDGLWEYNPLTNEVWYADQFKALIGYRPDEYDEFEPTFDSFVSILHPEDKEATLAAVESHLTKDTPYDVEYRLRMRDGGYRWFRARGESVRDEQGNVKQMAGSISDTQAKHDAQQQLIALEKQMRLFVEHTPAAVAMFDTDMRYLLVSHEWHKQFDLEDEDIIGRSHYDVFPTIPQRWKELHQRTLAGEPLSSDRDSFVSEDGLKIWTRWTLRPWHRPDGEIGGLIMFVQVINEQIRYEKELESAKEQAEAASLAKSEFLANMSHEIRTPMTAILGYTDLLAGDMFSDPKQVAEAITTIQSNASHLLTIINDILDVSKIEAGQMAVESIPTNPVQIAEEVASLVGPRAHGKGVAVRVRYDTPMPESIASDPTRLRQILLNLAGNAIKFTEVGSVDTRRLRF